MWPPKILSPSSLEKSRLKKDSIPPPSKNWVSLDESIWMKAFVMLSYFLIHPRTTIDQFLFFVFLGLTLNFHDLYSFLGKFSGTSTPQRSLKTLSNTAVVKFVSDSHGTSRGFNLTFQVCLSVCLAVRLAASSVFVSACLSTSIGLFSLSICTCPSLHILPRIKDRWSFALSVFNHSGGLRFVLLFRLLQMDGICPSDLTSCDDDVGTCYASSERCDGVIRCLNGNDEKGCRGYNRWVEKINE